MRCFWCKCKVRSTDVISGDTKLFITPFPEEYMLILLYIAQTFYSQPDWNKNDVSVELNERQKWINSMMYFEFFFVKTCVCKLVPHRVYLSEMLFTRPCILVERVRLLKKQDTFKSPRTVAYIRHYELFITRS